ncbi:MAG: hypothetical protein KAR87_00935 [Candidatus Aenigmarchaeota archaeon]|nr:hypothetical protein [Candidatus Aenigmarchaeota archaeon]
MSIKNDSLAILKHLIEKKNSNSVNIISYFEFEKARTDEALEYLEQKGYITAKKMYDGNWRFIKPTSLAIDYYEELTKEEKKKQEKHTQANEDIIKKETLDQLSRIERNINILHSRRYREVNYNTSLYPLIIASFIAIGFTSLVEFLKIILPLKYEPILRWSYYSLMFISILVISKMSEKMRKNLEVDDYVVLLKIKEDNKNYDLLKNIRKIFEDNDHQLFKFRPTFEGILLNSIIFKMKSIDKSIDIDRKEQILKDKFNKETKKVYYEFKYINRRGIFSSFTLDLKKLKLKIEIDKGTDYKIANKIYDTIMKLNKFDLIEKSGWNH